MASVNPSGPPELEQRQFELPAAAWAALTEARAQGSAMGPSPVAESLRAAGAIDMDGRLEPSLARAIEIVATAPVEIVVVAGALDRATLGRYHLAPAADRPELVGAVVDAAGVTRISYPQSPELIVGLLDGLLDLEGPSVEIPFAAELGFAEFSALLGLVDALRTQQLRAALERRPATPAPVTGAELGELVRLGREVADDRWWATMGRRLVPEPLVEEPPALGAALEQLATRGLLERRETGFVPSEQGSPLVASLLAPLSYASVVFMQRGAGGLTVDHVAALRTGTLFWVLTFAGFGGPAPTVALAAQAPAAFLELVTGLLGLYASPAAEAMAEPPAAGLPAGAPLAGSLAGSPPTAAASVPCTRCGQANPAGMRFCGACGGPLNPEPAPSPPVERGPRTCPACGTVAREGAAFCGNCGTGLD